ncbi:MAG: 3-dehydroquinate synthase [Magnetococcales bacterium]|nr:3-dehydroquinate synthase [Magnetococcales bacterium]MBF0110704.1 3-dehydroquinate synthase [Magnetococcales bacterium]MBF0116757.1 3-dehydroquinate synthase [Magnetococcales bacterium]
MSEQIVIKSHKGPYTVFFNNDLLVEPEQLLAGTPHFLIDSRVAHLYRQQLGAILDHPHVIAITATEENKSIGRIIPIIEQLVANKIRRDHVLVAIGGGILQDITCFIASTLLRGIPWKFVPTTLLAQADSCIGSKSSINLGPTKNILGTFNPPNEIFICQSFLDTLEAKEVLSGVGEIIKVHAIEGKEAFDSLARDYDRLLHDRATLLHYIHAALRIKQRFIEVDEFDRGVRNIFNYGHSFGHAIESATDFSVPHGIAVAMGMDMANRISVLRGWLPERQFERMHGVLLKNHALFSKTPIPMDLFMGALMKDKKNTATKLVLILPHGEETRIERVQVDGDELFRRQCERFLQDLSRSVMA